MKARDYLWCALNLMLDREEVLEQLCPSCRQKAALVGLDDATHACC